MLRARGCSYGAFTLNLLAVRSIFQARNGLHLVGSESCSWLRKLFSERATENVHKTQQNFYGFHSSCCLSSGLKAGLLGTKYVPPDPSDCALNFQPVNCGSAVGRWHFNTPANDTATAMRRLTARVIAVRRNGEPTTYLRPTQTPNLHTLLLRSPMFHSGLVSGVARHGVGGPGQQQVWLLHSTGKHTIA